MFSNGSILGRSVSVTTGSAKGIWDLNTILLYRQNSSWPTVIKDYLVDFEDASKSSYGSGSIFLNTLEWNFTEAVIGTTVSDFKTGSRSARLRANTGASITMLQDKPSGIGNISFDYAIFGTDTTQEQWIVEYSIDSGNNWINAGTFTATSTPQVFTSSNINNPSNNVRLRIRTNYVGATTNRRCNIDNLTITRFL